MDTYIAGMYFWHLQGFIGSIELIGCQIYITWNESPFLKTFALRIFGCDFYLKEKSTHNLLFS